MKLLGQEGQLGLIVFRNQIPTTAIFETNLQTYWLLQVSLCA